MAFIPYLFREFGRSRTRSCAYFGPDAHVLEPSYYINVVASVRQNSMMMVIRPQDRMNLTD